MKFIVLLLLFAVLCKSQYSCLGSPSLEFGERNFNCFTLCCAEGYVINLNQTGVPDCVSCASVGLIMCKTCVLLPYSPSGNMTYKCLASMNIPNLVTVGISSLCTTPAGIDDYTYVLSNYTNFNSCIPCSDIIPNALKCSVAYVCKKDIQQSTGNDCSPYIKALNCIGEYSTMGKTDDLERDCQPCGRMMYGCVLCTTATYCISCNSSLGLETRSDNLGCKCKANASNCKECGTYQQFNEHYGICECVQGAIAKGGKCVPQSPCPANQGYNLQNSSCQCIPGYVRRSNNQTCIPLECHQPNMEVSPTGVCVCKLGYVFMSSVGCYLVGSFPATAPTYAHQYSGVGNLTNFFNLTNYPCGCPNNYTYKAGYCIHCQLTGLNCTCPGGYFWNSTSRQCRSCILRDISNPNCLDCPKEGISPEGQLLPTCRRCAPGYYLKQHLDKTVSLCVACTVVSMFGSCSMCPQTALQIQTNNSCKICKVGYGKFTDIDGSCQPCTAFKPNCISCYFNSSDKSGIVDSMFKCFKCQRPFILENNNCVCPNPTPRNSPCINCQVGCMKCYDGVCIQCLPEFIKDITNRTCICPSPDLSIQFECEGCKRDPTLPTITGERRMLQGCLKCSSPKTCATCVDGYLKTEGNCQLCSRYMMGCLKCTNRTFCTQCDDAEGYKLTSNACVCKDEATRIVNYCSPCNRLIDHCLTCFTRALCKSCQSNYTLVDNKQCICTRQHAISPITGRCLKCSDLFGRCSTCNSTHCFTCPPGYLLQTNQSNSGVCVESPCAAAGFACLECLGGKYCTYCSGEAIANYGMCQCPSRGYYRNMELGQCQKCLNTTGSACLSCINSPGLCTQCTLSFPQMQIYQGKCQCAGQSKYYVNYPPQCRNCPNSCSECFDQFTCTDCRISGKILINGRCYCPQGTRTLYPVNENNIMNDTQSCINISELQLNELPQDPPSDAP